jgi:RNA polymerase sigma-70 factor (ECF subfamily)
MTRYAGGDAAAFDRLFARFASRVHAFFARSFRDAAVADELLQTTFLKVHRGRTTYQAGALVRPWLFAIAARVRKDELRRRYRINEDCDEETLARAEEVQAAAQARSVVDADQARDTIDQVRAALDTLPEAQRVVIQLHRYEEMKFHEIAAVLGLTETAVRARASRGYEQLRKELEPLLGRSRRQA